MVVTIQVRQRGTLTLPTKLRAKYNIQEGDVFTLIDLDGLLVLSPRLSVVPKLAGEIERLRQEADLSLDDLLEGLDEERRRYLEEHLNDGQ
jgi:bifunctional DNA-binding transcriptional regulator/antitoxin component of YhaV-PrlF toxin-antitoxin module